MCEAQLQFAPRAPLPVFGGTYGPEVKKSIVDIQESFQVGPGAGRRGCWDARQATKIIETRTKIMETRAQSESEQSKPGRNGIPAPGTRNVRRVCP